MKFIMYANGMPFDGNTIKNGQSLGGSETIAFYVAEELSKRNHSVFMFCNVPTGKPEVVDKIHYMPIGNVTQTSPFGINFDAYVQTIPCDIVLAQRVPGLFIRRTNSKLNYFWMHDLALKRSQPHFNAMLWNTDKVLAVSEFHKNQIQSVYGPPEGVLDVLPNGIDLDLWKSNKPPIEAKIASKTLLYAARPERGLVNLVKEGGIMEKLLQYDPEIRLLVCSYNNQHPQMDNLYNYIYSRCEQLPNVQNIGFLSKQQLAQVEMNSWLYVYPTEFEDTSCIMIMESAAAGTPFIACKKGALEETGAGSGVYWTSIQMFEKAIMYLAENPDKYKQLYKKSLAKASDYSISKSVDKLESMIESDFVRLTKDKQKLFEYFEYTSEIYGAQKLLEQTEDEEIIEYKNIKSKYKTFNVNPSDTQDFYDYAAERNFEIGNTHGMNNHQQLLNMGRMQPVINQLQRLDPRSNILDYGCCVGQLSFALKTIFPDMIFHCVDINQKQLEVGRKYAKENKIDGIHFTHATYPDEISELGGEEGFAAILALEIVEHVWDYHEFLESICNLSKKDGLVIVSTPLGPYEQNTDEPNPVYQHLHNFEEDDILDIIKDKKDQSVVYIGNMDSKRGEKLGNYVWMWVEDHETGLGTIDWKRKFKHQRPRDRISVCMIVNDATTIMRCLESVEQIADEIIIGIDDEKWLQEPGPHPEDAYGGFDEVPIIYRILEKMYPDSPSELYSRLHLFPIVSPLIQGFAEARNKTIEKATKDWILWIDDDEVLSHSERFFPLVRNNYFDSYALHHHHLTAEPLGVLRTDIPTRMFRNGRGIQFYGIVHEHPETEINKGPGKVYMIPNELGCIMHDGYETEAVRRKRFMRNYPLMKRDRELNPERKLGKFLWIRDIAHVNRFILERNQGNITDEIIKNAKDAIFLWRSELSDPELQLRMLIDSLNYITECVNILTNGNGFAFRMNVDVNYRGLGDNLNAPFNPILNGVVETKEDLIRLYEILLNEKFKYSELETKYV